MATGLAAYKAERHEIKTKSTTFSVRGLTMPDVSRLVTLHLSDIESLYSKYTDVKTTFFSRVASDEFFIRAIGDFPELISEVISVCAAEGDDDLDELAKVAGTLPAGVQLETIHQIVRLTFEEAGGIKNLFASLVLTLRNALPVEVQARLATMVPMLATQTEQK